MAEKTLVNSADCRPAAERAARPPADAHAPAVACLHRFAERTGLSLLCVDARTGTVRATTDAGDLKLLPSAVLRTLRDISGPRVLALDNGLCAALLPLPDLNGDPTVAVGYALERSDLRPTDFVLAASERNWPQSRLNEWIARQLICPAATLEKLIGLAVRLENQEHRASTRDAEFLQLGEQLEQTYEEVSLMRTLARRLQISRGPGELAELCLERMHDLLGSACSAIWLAEKQGTPHFQVKGNGELAFDEIRLARLVSHFDAHDWSQPLVRNHVAGTRIGAEFPSLKNLIVVPVSEGKHRFGWIVSCNLRDGREFGTVEAGLINSVAAILGTHLRNVELYREHEELLLCFVKSLVSTLDAKDPYTRGHSERVALVARRLGEELQLSDKELHDLYLAGLLHDLGKIGVDDSILRKTGKLTSEEFHHIQQHPMIGWSILQGLKNLQQVLPGVRNHHEAYKGGGYPDGLVGENIPLMARILAVADSYDAMKSDRPYRKGMTRQALEEVLRREAGSQWDERVIEAYFRAAGDVERVCTSIT